MLSRRNQEEGQERPSKLELDAELHHPLFELPLLQTPDNSERREQDMKTYHTYRQKSS